MKMKQITAFFLALVLVLSLAACGTEKPADTTAAPDTTGTPAPDDTTSAGVPEINGTITYFTLSLSENQTDIRSLSAYPNEDGTFYVEYAGEEKKVGNLDASVQDTILAALEESGLVQLHGQDDYQEGDANASMYVSFSDEQMLSVGFSGKIPEAYRTGYAAMEKCFQELTKDLPVYVPQPIINGNIAEEDLAVMNEILDQLALENPDAYFISEVMKDEFFAQTLGLSSDAGIDRAISFAPMMMTSAYALNIVFLEDGADADAVCADFKESMDWRKWVCVAPSSALIAKKDGMVLCMMGSELFDLTKDAIVGAEWTVVEELKNPDM